MSGCMEEASCLTNSACEDIDYKPNLLSQDSNTENHTAFINTNGPVDIEVKEDCDHCSSIRVLVTEAQLEDIDSTSYEDNSANSVAIGACMESGPPVSYNGSMEKYLCRLATYPFSKSKFTHSFCMEENTGSPNIGGASSQDTSIDQFLIYKRSVSLPVPSTLISAMKGGRAEKGLTTVPGMRVKWAPDVYDPPTGCSLLQLVQSSNRPRSKSKKKEKLRHKHAKGKFAKPRPS